MIRKQRRQVTVRPLIASAQGLGKTVSTISLMLLNGRGGGPDVAPPVGPGGAGPRPEIVMDLSEERQDEERHAMMMTSGGDVAGGLAPPLAAADRITASEPPRPQARANRLGGGGGHQGEVDDASDDDDDDEDEDDGDPGRTRGLFPAGSLVVCPTSVLHQWAKEIRDKVNAHAGFSVHVYHGKVSE